MRSSTGIRAEWVAHLLSTAPADRPRAEAAVRRLFEAAGFQEPRHFLWFESPRTASWVVALIAERHHFVWAQKLSSSLSRDDLSRKSSGRDLNANGRLARVLTDLHRVRRILTGLACE